jgi:protein-disulfide isomerase
MSEKKPGKDNFTRYLVIGVVVAVLAIMVVPTVISKTKSVSQEIPSTVTAENGYAIAFNTELTGVPVVDIYEDFQCPICQQFEGINGQYINSLITDKKATVKFHSLSFIGPESVRAANAGREMAAVRVRCGLVLGRRQLHRRADFSRRLPDAGGWVRGSPGLAVDRPQTNLPRVSH